MGLGPEGAVSRFVDFGEEDEALDREIAALGPELDLRSKRPGAYGAATTGRLRRWWVYRMVRGAEPLQEKLALFWHDHFACQESKVIRTHLLLAQNELFRAFAAAPFGELLRAVARDPAMLVFLDNRLSEKGRPNENWARELVELFTLGVDRYTQRDVTELARVFTGWTTPRPDSAEFRFEPGLHDTGDKELLGRTIRGRAGERGIEEGDEAIEIILGREECSRFLAGKLLAWFADDGPAPAVQEELAARLRSSNYSIREALRALFRSAWFHAPERRFGLYKHPVELAVSAARAVELQNVHLFGLEQHLESMGMELFEPPSVAGWDHGEAWVRTGSVAPRLNFALALSELAHARRRIAGRASLDLDALAGAGDGTAALVAALAGRLLQRPLEPGQAEALAGFLDTLGPEPADSSGSPGAPGGREARAWRRERIRAGLHLVLATPQFALA